MPIRLKSPDNLFGRYLRAGSWVTIGTLGTQILRLGRMWALTWLLEPEYFGLVALVWTALALMKEMTETGISFAFIQNPKALEKRYMDTCWLAGLVRNAAMALLLFLAAAPIARGYQKPALESLIHLSCLVLLFEGLTSAGLLAMQKQLHFKPVKLIELAAQVGGITLTIILALLWKSPAVLVLGEAAIAAIICGASYLIHPFRPSWRWDKEALWHLAGFGIQIHLTQILLLAIFRIDVLILGKIATESELGLYCLAMALLMAVSMLFKQVAIQVGYAAYSQLEGDLDRLRNLTRQTMVAFIPVAIIVFTLCAILTPRLVHILPGKYATIAPLLRLLIPTGLLSVIINLVSPQLFALKRLRGCLWMAVLRIAFVALLVLPAYRLWGIAGFCQVMNGGMALGALTLWAWALYELKWPVTHFLRALWPVWLALLAGIAGAAAGFAINWTPGLAPLHSPVLPAIVGLLPFCAVTAVINYRKWYGPARPGSAQAGPDPD